MGTPTSTSRILLTVKQAAAAIPCSESTIKRRIRSGELPAVTFGESGRAYLIDPDDLEKLFVNTLYGKSAQGIAPTEADSLEAIAALIAAQAPALSAEHKARLRDLLS